MDRITELLIKLKLFNPLFIDPVTMKLLMSAASSQGGKGGGGKGGGGKGGGGKSEGKRMGENIAAVGAGIGGIAKFAKGAGQKGKAEAINTEDIQRTVSEESLANQAQAYNLAYGKDPAAEAARAGIDKTLAGAAGQMTKVGGVGALQALQGAVQGAGEQYGKLAADEAMRQRSAMSNLASARTAVAGEKEKIYQEKEADLAERKQTKAALEAAGSKNKMAGFQDVVAATAKIAENVTDANQEGMQKAAGVGGGGGDQAAPGNSMPGANGKKKKKPKPGIAEGTMPNPNASSKPGISPGTMGNANASSKIGLLSQLGG